MNYQILRNKKTDTFFEVVLASKINTWGRIVENKYGKRENRQADVNKKQTFSFRYAI